MPNIYSEEYKKFLLCLKRARSEAGLNQVDVAKRLKKPQSFVAKCESGERRLDVVELNQYAKIYKKDISFFIQ